MIRKTKNFNPKDHLSKSFQGQDQYGNAIWKDYLETVWRVQWFLEYCAEHSIKGVINDSNLDLIGNPPFLFWRATADVYMDGEKVGSSAAVVPAIGQDGVVDNYAAQTACTHAKGRALANAGFSAATTIAYEDGKNEFADAPVEVIQQPAPQNDSTVAPPAINQTISQQQINQPTANPYAPAPEVQPMPQNDPAQCAVPLTEFSADGSEQQIVDDVNNSQGYEIVDDSIFGKPMGPLCETPESNVEQKPASYLMDVMTPDMARAIVIPNGKHAQQKMGDVYLSDPGYVKWIVEKGHFKTTRPDLYKAATILNEL